MSTAWAQTMTPPFDRNIDVQHFRPALGPSNFLTVMGSRVDGHMAVSAGAWANYSNGGFVIYQAECPSPDNDDNCRPGARRSTPIQHLATLNLHGTLTVARRVQIGIDLPVTLAAGDEVRTSDAMATGQFTTGGVGDPRLDVKVRLAGEGLNGPGFAVNVFGQFPVGRYVAQDRYVGDENFIVGGRVIGEFRRGPFAIGANAGVMWRPRVLQVLSSYVGSRLIWGAAASFDITPRITGILEFFGSSDFERPNVIQQNAVEGALAGRYRLGDVALTLGGGTGILRGVGAPAARVFLGAVYAPYRADTDNDRVQDDADRCVTEPEDRDGYEDQDGCPDPDNDGDGILDERDRCVDEAEDRDNFQDQDGCPDRDNDNDGVPDGYDTCPAEPEDRDGDRDDDGCPDNDRDRDGVPDDRDRCATEPEDTDGFNDEDGCPDPDNDNDRVLDAQDQCGEQPETYNGYQDDDGCPDTPPDRDHDGIQDEADRCPDQPETYNGQQDDDGCPERGPQLVNISEGQIRILNQVNFATNSDRIIGARSFAVLDAVVAILNAHPELGGVDIQGHTDNRGDAERNRDLSRRRAEAVRTYLVTHGIPANRLEAHGFGPDRPIESNANNRGRARNRRVEFHLTGPAQAAGAAGGGAAGGGAAGEGGAGAGGGAAGGGAQQPAQPQQPQQGGGAAGGAAGGTMNF